MRFPPRLKEDGVSTVNISMKKWFLGLSSKKRKIFVILLVMVIVFSILLAYLISWKIRNTRRNEIYPQKVIAEVVSICVSHTDSITWNDTIVTKSDITRTFCYSWNDITYTFEIPDKDMPFWHAGICGYNLRDRVVARINPDTPQEVVLTRGNNVAYTADVLSEEVEYSGIMG